jgi:hypothetical protein
MTEGHSRFLTSGGEAVTQMRAPSKEMFHPRIRLPFFR